MQAKKRKTTSVSRNHKRKKSNVRAAGKKAQSQALPLIPDKRYFTIGEVSLLCGVKPHVLRYWEQEFSQLKPAKRRGNRRYYQSKDVLMVRSIRTLLYEKGFTLDGARVQLLSQSVKLDEPVKTDTVVKDLIADLEGVLQKLKLEEVL